MSDVYTAFKPIRNKIRKYTPISIIGMAIDIMHSHIDSVDTVEQWLRPHNTYLPHTIMLMIRLVYQCSEANPNARDITSNEFKELHFAIYKLADNVGLSLSGQESVNKGFSFLKRIMNQQIMYQVKDYEVHAAFSRQLILFEDMGSDYDINNKFMEIAGITLKEFFQISFSCWTMLNIKENRHLSISMLEHIFPTNYLQGFFRIVSRDIDGAKKYIRQHPGSKKAIDFQLFEHSPLERYPFLKYEDRYIPYSIRLFNHSLKTQVYRIFKEHNPNFSGGVFGEKIFPAYIQRGLEYANISFETETMLKRRIPKASKVVDFLVEEENAVIMIEVKSTEPRAVTRVMQDTERLTTFETSTLKGIEQIVSTASHLNNVQEKYGIIVTFGDYATVTHNNMTISDSETQNIILSENLFFISIEDFDFLVGGIKELNVMMSDILREVVSRNRSPETSCIFLRQHLAAMWSHYYHPDYVLDRTIQCISEIQERFPMSLRR